MTVGIKDAAKRMLAMPVRIGYPTNVKGIIDEVQHPAFSTVIGLCMYGSKTESKERSLPFGMSMPKMPGGSGALKKILSIIKSFIP